VVVQKKDSLGLVEAISQQLDHQDIKFQDTTQPLDQEATQPLDQDATRPLDQDTTQAYSSPVQSTIQQNSVPVQDTIQLHGESTPYDNIQEVVVDTSSL
jgi:hypothetical protein